jgi:hypothetical protein
MMKRCLPYRFYGVIILCLLAKGCGSTKKLAENDMEPVAERLLELGHAYATFNFQRGEPPKVAEDLIGLISSEEVLISQRDSAPFVVYWGVDLRKPPSWARGRPILAHEGQGINGVRYVLTTLRSVELLDLSEFESSSFPPTVEHLK